MAIFLTKDNKVVVQGITGAEATKHTARMLAAGTQIVGGVNARKAGTTVAHKDVDGNPIELPVFGSVVEAIEKTGADVSIAFVPPVFSKDAIIEAIDAEIPLLVVITEGIPVQDSAYAWAYNLEKGGSRGPKTRIIGGWVSRQRTKSICSWIRTATSPSSSITGSWPSSSNASSTRPRSGCSSGGGGNDGSEVGSVITQT